MTRRLSKGLPALVGVLLALPGLACLLAPGRIAAQLALFPAGPLGYGNLRGDLAAFFLGMAAFALLGAVRAERRWLVVPTVFLTLVLPGRLVNFAVEGRTAGGLQSLVIELVLIGMLLFGIRALGPSAEATARPGGPRSWRVLWGAGAVVALLVVAAVAFQRPIGMRLTAAAVANLAGKQPMNDLPDGLHVGLCGSGSPMPDALRAGPCVFVIAGKHLYVVDAGEGSPRKLALMGLPPPLIDTILLTHFHSDHIGGLGEMMLQRWAGSGSRTPVEVIGPQGVETVVAGFNHAYAIDTGYRVAHHGAATLPPTGAGGVPQSFLVPQGSDFRQVVLERDGLKITAFNVIHTPVFPAVGYRFDYQGRSAVVSGDTAPSQWLANNAQGADVLLHEALQPEMVAMLHERGVKQGNRIVAKITADIPSYHTTPEDAARLAAQAGVGHLVFYHTIPPLPSTYLYPAFLGDAAARYHGPITVAKDGLLVSLPKGSRGIVLRELL